MWRRRPIGDGKPPPALPTAEELHERHLETVFRYVSRRIRRRDEAEDVTAEVFAAAFQALPLFRGECEPHLWLLGIARRKVADALRRASRRREAPFSDLGDGTGESAVLLEALATDVEGPAASLERAEHRQAVRAVMDGLPDQQREALLLKYVEELPTVEVARVIGRSPAATNSLLQRARAAFVRRGRAYFVEDSPTVALATGFPTREEPEVAR